MSTKSQSALYNLLLERNWPEALDLLEQDPTQAREWHYGVDENSGTTTEPVLWKRLALHLACAVAAPIGLVELLLKIYPEAIDKSDPHNGSTPLHLSCQFGASVQVVRALLQARTALTKAVDVRGRMALHYAVLAAAPFPIIELLVQHDPASALCPDQDSKTPLQYAHYVYLSGSHIMGFLETVWI
jgi:ankyrin repeat protein